jgi:phage terminase large subunit-like protein
VRTIVAEGNAGGLMIESVVRLAFIDSDASDHLPRVELIRAEEDKSARAEPTSALYEANWVHHHGNLIRLEEEQCTWVPKESKYSPGRIYACVHAVNFLNPNISRGGALRTAKTR